MKLLFYTLLMGFVLVVIQSCNNKKEKSLVVKEGNSGQHVVAQDTIRTLVTQSILQEGILLDTVRMNAPEGHADLHMVFPVLPAKADRRVSDWVKQIVGKRRKEFIQASKADAGQYDSTASITDGWHMYLEPRLLYRSDSLLSFVIQDGEGARGMGAMYWYRIITLDLIENKKIGFEDYFLFKTAADSSFFENLFGRIVGYEFDLKDYLRTKGKVKFGVDKNNVYFFFDRWEIIGWGDYSIQKKHIVDHINPTYR